MIRRIISVFAIMMAFVVAAPLAAQADTVTTSQKTCAVAGARDYLVSLTWARPTSTTARPSIVNFSLVPGTGIARKVWAARTNYAGTSESASIPGVLSGSYVFVPGSLARRSVSATVTLYTVNTSGNTEAICTTTASVSG